MTRRAPLLRRLGLGLFGVLLLGALAFVAMRSGPLAPTRITVHTVQEGSFIPALFGIGTVEARRAYLIGPTTAGRVLRVLVDVGDTVRAGQLLAEMDPVDFAERLAALDASLARGASTVAAVEAQRKDALARRELAAISARRYAELAEKNFVSTGSLEGKVQEQTSADAAVSAVDANLAAARQDLLRLGAERAALRQQRDNVRLLAPADGLVTSRDAEAGSTVVAGQPVLRLIEPASQWVKVRFDQGRSRGLAPGLPASIALRSSPTQPLPGKLVRVEAVSDSVTEERLAQVAFERIPAALALGELAEVTVSLPATAKALQVPNASIKRLGDKTGVWVLDGHALRFAPVRLGQASLDGQVQVLDGLRQAEQVVVYSDKELVGGSRIQVVDTITGSAP